MRQGAHARLDLGRFALCRCPSFWELMSQSAPRTPPAVLHLHPTDNVAVATRTVPSRSLLDLDGRAIPVLEPIRLGHKVAIEAVPKGHPIRKYGQTIGFASEDIAAGAWIHVHNCSADLFERDYAFASEVRDVETATETRYFRGYRRSDGRAATRNYVAVISTVNCSATTSRAIADRFRGDALRAYPNVDGIVPITHKGGCAMQYGGPDHAQLERVLAGFARHANVAAYVLVGLGCETGQASHLIQSQKLVTLDGIVDSRGSEPPLVITIQEAGGIRKTVEAGVEAVARLLARVNHVERVPIPAAELILGTNCGGSDGNSGVTANPALGVAGDLLVAQGGTVILGETPEIYGAEHLLTRRAVTRAVGEKLIERIRWWEWYTSIFGAEINNNPSPGNKDGGLTTIYEKSLGAVAKGGSTPLTAVYGYAEPVSARGFVVMDTPGYDPTSMTGIVAGGANVCVFTTGRGSVYGCKPSPSIKVATNTPLYERMIDDMDINAGVILDGTPLQEVGRAIFEEILAVASGKQTKSELAGVGEEEFSPWQVGPVL